jgi:hypothetical protein
VRHEAGDAAVAVDERVNPKKPVVGSGSSHKRIHLAGVAVDVSEAFEETRDGSGTDGDMLSDLNIAVADCAGVDADALAGDGVFNPKKILRERLGEPAVHFADSFGRCGASAEASLVDPLLDRDVRLCFKLQVAFARVAGVVVPEGAFDIDGVRVVPFDEVGIVAVHRTDEVSKGGEEAGWEAALETGGFVDEVEGKIRDALAVTVGVAEEQRLHQRREFISVFRQNVRFHGLLQMPIKYSISIFYERLAGSEQSCNVRFDVR